MKRFPFFESLAVFILTASSLSASYFVYIMNIDGTIMAIDPENNHAQIPGSPFGTPSMMTPAVSVVVNPNGTRCYASGWLSSDTISVFDINPSTGALSHISGSPFTIPGGAPFSVAISPDSTKVYATLPGTNELAQYDADLNPIGVPVSTGANAPHGIAISPDGQSIYVVYTNTALLDKFDSNLAHVAGPVSSGGINPGNAPYAVIVNPSGTRVYVTNPGTSEIAMFDTNLIPIANSSATLLAPIGMDINQNETVLYVANTGNSTVSILDPNTLASLQPNLSSQGTNCYFTGLNPEETLLYTTNGGMAPTPFSIRDVANSYMPITGSPFPSPLPQYFAAFAPRPSSQATNLTGHQEKNSFGIVYELFNLLKWTPTPQAAGYFVYRNGEKIATLNSSTFKYEDHNRPKGVKTTYSVTSFDANGNESSPSTIEI
jgi:DNA-binding beta-propeller fold protein YncE